MKKEKSLIENYIDTLHNYKKCGGNIDDAIMVAEFLLLNLETKQREKDFNAGKQYDSFSEYIQMDSVTEND